MSSIEPIPDHHPEVDTRFEQADSTMTQIFRSKKMAMVQIIVPSEAAHDSVEEIAKTGVMQFIGNSFQNS